MIEEFERSKLPLLPWMVPLFFFFFLFKTGNWKKRKKKKYYHTDMESLAGKEDTEGKGGQAS
jgi:hypothetical protein